jgi:malonyl-CoA O-methyltransferase
MNIEDAYSAWAASYDSDRNLTRDLDAEVTRSLVGPGPIPVVVEAGCGTGKNTSYLSQVAATVHALDFSPGMLEVARRNVPAPNVHFHQTDLSADWPVRPNYANLVSFNLVLEHIQDIAEVIQKAAAVLLPGGRLFISELHPFKQYQNSQARFVNAEGNEIKVPAFTHNISEYLGAAQASGLQLVRFDEWWHREDQKSGVPRLATFVFEAQQTA